MTTTDSTDMQRDFADRAELIAYLRAQFPDAAARDDHVSAVRGGRAAAEAQLAKADPARYGRTRNALSGAATRLSPYLRYGVLSLAETRDFVLTKMRNRSDGYKLISELAWRDYWQRLYAEMGSAIWNDQETYKTGFSADEYARDLPDDLANGTTGLVCMDAFSQELRETGYLHNHARMWLAAYVIHWRRVRWQAGARWFLAHLLDGDPASNNLSWQWVASTFSHKPYFFNRENLEKYTDGVYCKHCPLYNHCDFEGEYAEIGSRLFPHTQTNDEGRAMKSERRRKTNS